MKACEMSAAFGLAQLQKYLPQSLRALEAASPRQEEVSREAKSTSARVRVWKVATSLLTRQDFDRPRHREEQVRKQMLK
eukprot:6466175-Amphidinium_carterae.1